MLQTSDLSGDHREDRFVLVERGVNDELNEGEGRSVISQVVSVSVGVEEQGHAVCGDEWGVEKGDGVLERHDIVGIRGGGMY